MKILRKVIGWLILAALFTLAGFVIDWGLFLFAFGIAVSFAVILALAVYLITA